MAVEHREYVGRRLGSHGGRLSAAWSGQNACCNRIFISESDLVGRVLCCRNRDLLRFREEKEAEAEGHCGGWEGTVH